jgi:hypothetical protein
MVKLLCFLKEEQLRTCNMFASTWFIIMYVTFIAIGAILGESNGNLRKCKYCNKVTYRKRHYPNWAFIVCLIIIPFISYVIYFSHEKKCSKCRNTGWTKEEQKMFLTEYGTLKKEKNEEIN